VRPASLSAARAKAKTPGPEALRAPERRARIAHTFLHHELQAAELMCWAILAFPRSPEKFRLGLAKIACDEVRHMGMYADYLASLGFAFGDFPVRDWFWERVPSAETPAHFVATMGMGFEGNLITRSGSPNGFAGRRSQRREPLGHPLGADPARALRAPMVSQLDRSERLLLVGPIPSRSAFSDGDARKPARARRACASRFLGELHRRARSMAVQRLWLLHFDADDELARPPVHAGCRVDAVRPLATRRGTRPPGDAVLEEWNETRSPARLEGRAFCLTPRALRVPRRGRNAFRRPSSRSSAASTIAHFAPELGLFLSAPL
jgi:hypothetical protein